MSGNCKMGAHCKYRHEAKKDPCKFLNTQGICLYGQHCHYSHERLTPEEINPFIEANKDFIASEYRKRGITNLGIYYLDWLAA